MHMIDINTDIERRDLTGLREAFRALACREDIVIDDNADPITEEQRDAALDAVCAKLAGDGAIMPSGACAELDLEPGCTYGDAVILMTTSRAAWEAMQEAANGERS